MQVSKITLSEEEINVLKDANFFHLKHDATQKILELFGDLERTLKAGSLLHDLHFENLEKTTGKIFRGENYRKLPYVVLDYPKLFSADNVLAFRTMFWWGNEFSFTLHLQGQALDKYRETIQRNISSLLNKEFYFCIHTSPWQYYFADDNYILLDELFKNETQLSELLAQKPFIKLSRKIPVKDYDKVIEYGMETFRLLFTLLK